MGNQTENLDVVKGWLEQCLSHHDSCRKRARLCTVWSTDNMHIVRDLVQGDNMPRRLLKISQTPVASNVILVQLKEEAPFVALSHRWGKTETCITMKSNVEELETCGLALEQMPQTYREAIEWTAQLGYSYIWIDSLCIIQDDENDWKEEAPRMAVVYGNADITIAAMDAEDNNGGLFVENMEDDKRGCLDSRGWVIQERMVSPRTVLFTRNSIFWECRQADAILESRELILRSTTALPSLDKQYDTSLSKIEIPDHPKELFAFFRDFRLPGVTLNEDEGQFGLTSTSLLAEKEEYEPFLRAWWKFVKFYTPLNLTYGKDKFLAMNAIASVPFLATQMKNSFGLWYHFIENELLWSIDLDGPEATKPDHFRAPSWTWASLDKGRVLNKYYERLPVRPRLMLKPSFGMPVGTSFDQILPIPAWTAAGPDFYGITMSGDLRSAEVTARLSKDGKLKYNIVLDPVGRYSEEEQHIFMPDIASWFPVNKMVKVLCLHAVQYAKEDSGYPYDIDIRLVLIQTNTEKQIQLQKEYVPEIELKEERTMRRVGYMETMYSTRRDPKDTYDDIWWKYLRLK